MKAELMNAVVCKSYGSPDVLELTRVSKPQPKSNQVRIKVRATAVTNSDIFIRSSKMPLHMLIPMRLAIGIRRPRAGVIGLVFTGDVEVVGAETSRFKPGDKVYGLSGYTLGAYAEYLCLAETDSIKGCMNNMPSNISYEEATAAVYGGLLAMQFMEKGEIGTGADVMIYGACGTTGTMAVQYAKYLGARVTAVCSTRHIDTALSLGADDFIDYTQQDEVPENRKYDFILDAVGKMKSSKLKISAQKALRNKGRYVSIDDSDLKLDSARLGKITKLVETGALRPVLGRTFEFRDIVEAHRFVEQGHKTGGVAIRIT